jgi:endonuclease YncB( thermonuclease family)
VKLRLAGIDAPESGQDFGQRAKHAASELAFGKAVTVRASGQDRYGRTLGDVLLPDGRSLSRVLVRSGYAWWYREHARNDGTLARLEAEARSEGRGLWSRPNPVQPWRWRKGEGVPVTGQVVGNRRSRIYHAPHCRSIDLMKSENRVVFQGEAWAEEAGYAPARDCRK